MEGELLVMPARSPASSGDAIVSIHSECKIDERAGVSKAGPDRTR
jgi:hypothetical protein